MIKTDVNYPTNVCFKEIRPRILFELFDYLFYGSFVKGIKLHVHFYMIAVVVVVLLYLKLTISLAVASSSIYRL